MRFTCAQLAMLELPGYPTSRQGWDKLVKEKVWSFEEFKGKGRGGIRREYTPPLDVMALIEARQRGELPYSERGPKAHQARKPGSVAPVRIPLATGGKVKAELLQPSAEWMLLCAVAIADADWIPKKEKRNHKEEYYLVSTLYSMLVYSLGVDEEKWLWMLDHPEALQHALRFVHTLRQMELELSSPAES